MILYLETSRLVKLFFEENDSVETRALVKKADAVAVSIVAYAEARAAFARKRTEQEIEAAAFRRLRDDFDRDWESMCVIGLNERVVREAVDLAEKHGLRGFDAIHLASASALAGWPRSEAPREKKDGWSEGARAGDSLVDLRLLVFCTADLKLRVAARAEGLETL